MIVTDDTAAIDCLRRNGYYRLSAYWFPFRKIVSGIATDEFLDRSHFDDAVRLYQFDKDFKLLLLDALERVEIAVRVEIALRLGQFDPFAHENPSLFRTQFTSGSPSKYDLWIDKFNQQVSRSRAQFILHFENKHGSRAHIPIWIAIELWDFGLLSTEFSGMKNLDQGAIANRFSVPDGILLTSWLRSLNYVRNIIAHHGRLWNTRLVQTPSLPRLGQITAFDPLVPLTLVETKIYSICYILCYLTSIINPSSIWVNNLKNLIKTFPIMPHANLADMGFPSDWESHSIWE
jgi:abortive infection bacteriophage resistance protein